MGRENPYPGWDVLLNVDWGGWLNEGCGVLLNAVGRNCPLFGGMELAMV